jgi:tetratricopeptide (TPR) repeat protein
MLCRMSLFLAALWLLGVGAGRLALAQDEWQLEPSVRVDTVRNAAKIVREKFCRPQDGRLMSDRILANLEQGDYDGLTNPRDLAQALMRDLTAVSPDGHLVIEFNPDGVRRRRAEMAKVAEGSQRADAADARERDDNFGFKEVKQLPGGIGYLRLDSFANTYYASETAVAAMNLLANSRAIIIDLRRNPGGSPTMVQLLASYFYDDDDVELFTVHVPYLNRQTQYRVFPFLPGKRLVDVDLYILTSRQTGSAAESFAYTLQSLCRAKVIGEQTSGAAGTTGGPRIVNDYYLMYLSVAETIYAATGTNYEQTGVTPDLVVPADQAMLAAYQQVIDETLAEISDPNWFNDLGYRLVGDNQMDIAIRVFQHNVKVHPDYANGFDSLGETYRAMGQTKLAIEAYERALKLDPAFESSRLALEELRGRPESPTH